MEIREQDPHDLSNNRFEPMLAPPSTVHPPGDRRVAPGSRQWIPPTWSDVLLPQALGDQGSELGRRGRES